MNETFIYTYRLQASPSEIVKIWDRHCTGNVGKLFWLTIRHKSSTAFNELLVLPSIVAIFITISTGFEGKSFHTAHTIEFQLKTFDKFRTNRRFSFSVRLEGGTSS